MASSTPRSSKSPSTPVSSRSKKGVRRRTLRRAKKAIGAGDFMRGAKPPTMPRSPGR